MGQSEHSKDLGSLSTVHLLNEAKSGSLEAREALVARYLPRLQKWARGRIPSSARGVLETDDIVQDTLLQTLHNLDAFDPEHSGAFRGYVRRAAQNRIFDEYRRVSRRPSADQSAGGIAHPGPSPLEAAIGKERVENYEAALERLKPRDQEAITARLEDGMSYSEIGQELGIKEDAARMVVKRALFRLAQEMAKDANE
jgi:RNA polymerase sigma-70 factor (ECF subfamily)